MKRSRSLSFLSGFLLVTAVASFGCAGAPAPRGSRVPVVVAQAEKRAVPFALLSTGTVEAIRTAEVGSQVGGVITRVALREGDEVREGQVLFQLDPRQFGSAHDRAAATLDRNRANARLARSEANRARELFSRNVVSQAEWDQKRAAADAAVAQVAADSAAERSARLDLNYATIRAPISGRSGRLQVHEGDYIKSATSEPLVTINQTRPVRVSFTVPVDAVPLVQRYREQNPRVFVRPAGEDSSIAFEGALVFVDNAVDPSSGTLLLKGELPNKDGRLVPGQFVDVRLVLYIEPDATVVPAQAVTAGQEGKIVYVLNADSTVTARPVTAGRTVDEMTIVTQGLTAGETVITDGQLRLSPGAKVQVRAAAGAPAAAAHAPEGAVAGAGVKP